MAHLQVTYIYGNHGNTWVRFFGHERSVIYCDILHISDEQSITWQISPYSGLGITLFVFLHFFERRPVSIPFRPACYIVTFSFHCRIRQKSTFHQSAAIHETDIVQIYVLYFCILDTRD